MIARRVPEPANNRGLLIGLVLFAVILAVQIVAERMLGRIWICECGTIKLWEGGVNTSGNSQHLADWYTPSHIIHGFLFYFAAWLVLPRSSFWLRLVLAVAVEGAWEIAENTPVIIERYRAGTISLAYYGDSIVNSLADTGAMIVGFILAALLPVWLTIGLAVVMEVGVAVVIRDNLVLNILMLIHPVDIIRQWQSGA